MNSDIFNKNDYKNGIRTGTIHFFTPSLSDEIIDKLNDKAVVLSSGTVTIKDDNGKTCGMLRSLKRFINLQASKQFAAWQILKKIDNGAKWAQLNLKRSQIYFEESTKTLYYINNINSRYIYSDKFCKAFPEDCKKEIEVNNMLRLLESPSFKIVNCYIKGGI